MLSPIDTPRTLRRFKTYDLEWVPEDGARPSLGWSLRLRMAGVFDGLNYRYYTSVDDFLQGELTRENSGTWYYAHFGGGSDMVFILQRLFERRREYQVSASFSGSSAIIVRVRRGRYSWLFLDSAWLFNMALRKVGKALGLEKGGEEGSTEIFNAPLAELAEYNYQDCRILWIAIYQFELFLLERGGQLQPTIASCAMQLFRRRFLQRSIPTDHALNQRCREGGAYTSSRVEGFAHGKVENILCYDVNSAFPYAATTGCPGQVLRTDRKLSSSCLADCTVYVPPMYLPPLPVRRRGNRVFFPYGRWRAWFMYADLQLLEEVGGRIEHVHESTHFEEFYDLRDYMLTIYEDRKKAVADGNDFYGILTKILMNGIYGKFGEQRQKTSLVFDPPSTRCPHRIKHENDSCLELLFPGAWLITDEADLDHERVVISAHITAVARANLYRFMADAASRGRIYYSDTDSIFTNVELPTSPELGSLKLEAPIAECEFIAPKVYAYRRSDNGQEVVKAKGFRKLSFDDFLRLKEGQTVSVTRMVRIREAYRTGDTTPREQVYRKKFQNRSQPKRCKLPDGDTRPWSIEEIE